MKAIGGGAEDGAGVRSRRVKLREEMVRKGGGGERNGGR